MSTSTRNFPNRMGKDTNVYLGSAELAAVCSILGRLPTVEEYLQHVKTLEPLADDVYRYLNFHEIAEYKKVADKVIPIVAA
jgi:aconitate hydratase 2/2-methylisocitrate dehydratase